MLTSRKTVVVVVGLVLFSMVASAAFSDVLTPASNTVPIGTQSGTTVYVDGQGDFDINLQDPWINSTALRVETKSGNATVIGSANSNVTVSTSDLSSSNWANISNIDASNGDVTVDFDASGQRVTVGKQVDNVSVRASPAADDGTIDFVYDGDTSKSKVAFNGVAAKTQYAAIDADSDAFLDGATSDSNGRVVFSDLDNSEHDVVLQTSDGNPPALSNADPTGNLSVAPSELSVNVSDSDFPQDNVSVEYYYDGSKIDTKYTKSDGEVSTTNVPTITGGTHNVTYVATDVYGDTDKLETTLGVPNTLYIRNETNTSELIDSPPDIEIRWVGDDQVYTNTTSDGTVDMNGLPVQDFIVDISAASDYSERSVYINSIIQQQTVYLLNNSYSSVESRFVLEDTTGQFDQSTRLYIQKPVEVSGETKYRTIHSDEFGTEGVTATLQEGSRYQLRIESEDGTTQEIGTYRADVSETVTIRPTNPAVTIQNYEKGWGTNTTLDNTTLHARYQDPDKLTDKLTIYVHERNNKSNQLAPNKTFFDIGDAETAYSLTTNESEKTWVVNYVIERDGERYVVSDIATNNADLFASNLSGVWRHIFGIGALLLFGGMFSVLNRSVGAVMTGLTGGLLWWGGWLAGATSGAAVVLYLFVAFIYSIYTKNQPGGI